MTWKVKQHANGTYLVYDDDDWYVMSCQDKQRAQLIATAPQMLEALERMIEVYEAHFAPLPDGQQPKGAYTQARAAIAAVKGDVDETELV